MANVIKTNCHCLCHCHSLSHMGRILHEPPKADRRLFLQKNGSDHLWAWYEAPKELKVAGCTNPKLNISL